MTSLSVYRLSSAVPIMHAEARSIHRITAVLTYIRVCAIGKEPTSEKRSGVYN